MVHSRFTRSSVRTAVTRFPYLHTHVCVLGFTLTVQFTLHGSHYTPFWLLNAAALPLHTLFGFTLSPFLPLGSVACAFYWFTLHLVYVSSARGSYTTNTRFLSFLLVPALLTLAVVRTGSRFYSSSCATFPRYRFSFTAAFFQFASSLHFCTVFFHSPVFTRAPHISSSPLAFSSLLLPHGQNTRYAVYPRFELFHFAVSRSSLHSFSFSHTFCTHTLAVAGSFRCLVLFLLLLHTTHGSASSRSWFATRRSNTLHNSILSVAATPRFLGSRFLAHGSRLVGSGSLAFRCHVAVYTLDIHTAHARLYLCPSLLPFLRVLPGCHAPLYLTALFQLG